MNQMRTAKGYTFRAYCSKAVSHHDLCFGRDSKVDRGVINLYSGKGKASGMP